MSPLSPPPHSRSPHSMPMIHTTILSMYWKINHKMEIYATPVVIGKLDFVVIQKETTVET